MIDCFVYFAVFAVVFAVNFGAMRQKNTILRNILVLISFLIMLIFIGFRYEVGTDYNNYIDEYNLISTTPWDKLPTLRIELFVAIVFKLCSFVLADARLIFVVLGLLLLYPVYKVNKLYDYKYLAYSILVFSLLFLPFGLNGMRQGIAMSFALLSMVYCIRGRKVGCIINIIVAVLFHTSSFIVIPYLIAIAIYKWKKISFTRMNIVITTVLVVTVLFLLNTILVDNGITKYSYILDSIDTDSISLGNTMLYLPILIITFALKGDPKNEEPNDVLKNLATSGLAFYAIGSAATYLSRFAFYFMMAYIILLPELVQSIQKKNTRLVVKVALILYLILLFYVQYSAYGWNEILPYKTWLLGGLG